MMLKTPGVTKPKSAARTMPATKTRSELAAEDQQELREGMMARIASLGMQYNPGALSELPIGEQEQLLEFLRHRGDTRTPDPFWRVAEFGPDQYNLSRLLPGITQQKFAKALAWYLMTTKRNMLELVKRRQNAEAFTQFVLDGLDEGATVTPYGSLIIDPKQPAIWFERQAGRPADFNGADIKAACLKLFAVPSSSDTQVAMCRVCGCTEDDCRECIEATGEPCHWVEPNLCSRCVPAEVRKAAPSPAATAKPKRRIDAPHPAEQSTAAPLNTKSIQKTKPADPEQLQLAELTSVAINCINPDPKNDRKHFDAESLKQLAESIKQHGILQPLLLRPAAAGIYTIVAGERRYRAAKLAGLMAVPAQIVRPEALQTSLMRLEENIRREDLTPIERAQAIARMMEEHGLTQAEVGKRLGVQQGQVSNELRLLKLPAAWQKKVAHGEIAPTLVRQLLPLTDYPQVFDAIDKELAKDPASYEDLTADNLEELARTAVLSCSRPMKFDSSWHSYQKPASTKRHFEKCSAENLKALDPHTFNFLSDWDGKERTFNLKLFHELNKEPLQKRKEKYEAERKKHRSSSSSSTRETKEPFERWKDHQIKHEIARIVGPLFVKAFANCKSSATQDRIALAIGLSGNLGLFRFGSGLGEAIAAIPADSKKMLGAVRALAFKRAHKYLGLDEMMLLAQLLGADITSSWKPTANLLGFLTDHGLELCRKVVEVPENLKGPALKKALIAKWPAGLIPDFLRPMFGLKKPAAAKKSKKAKAA